MARHRIRKFIFGSMLVPVLRAMFGLAYQRKYLRGRHFDMSLRGWGWALRGLLTQRLLRFNGHVPWPAGPGAMIGNPSDIEFHPDDLNNFQTVGVYLSNFGGGKIVIGRGTYIAPSVGIITSNHEPGSPEVHRRPKDVHIGNSCWLGMNSVVLPGVTLGDRTTVAAGAVVTKSFPEGGQILVGIPARVQRVIEAEPDRCV